MGELLTPEKLGLALLFLVPGIVILYFRAQFLTGRMPPASEGVIAYLVGSLVYQAVSYPASRFLFDPASLKSAWGLAGWFCLIFVSPAAVGVLLGVNARKGWIRSVVTKLGFHTVHPVNCAWDWRFGQCEECWVIAVLKDGTEWRGYLGAGSFMSSDAKERDLFIEYVYQGSDDGAPWTPRNSSVWIAHGELQSLEFLPR